MILMRHRAIRFLAGMAMLVLVGCGARTDVKPPAKAHEHAHPNEGPHGGALIEWGAEEFHAEFTVDHDKKEATIYILDETCKKAPNVKPEDITEVKLTIKNVTPPVTIDLKHDAGKSDEKGIAFTGGHEKLGTVMEFKGEVSGKVSGTPYVGDFEEKEHDHEHGKK
jgi:hypothetical protein